MDPNTNPTPNNVPTPEPTSAPETGFSADEISAVNPEAVVAEPVAPSEPASAPTTPAPVEPNLAASIPTETVAPATGPTAPATGPTAPAVEPVAPTAPIFAEPTTSASPIFQPTNEGIGATEPITRPDPVPVMSPEEKELAAPITAAGPVPGSIGSAVSVPSGAGPQSVTFNDPVNEAATMQNTSMAATAMPTKAKSNKVMLFGKEVDKKTLIITGVLAGILIIALVAILIMQLSM